MKLTLRPYPSGTFDVLDGDVLVAGFLPVTSGSPRLPAQRMMIHSPETTAALRELLECPDLNHDSLLPESRAAIERARLALQLADPT